MFIDSVHLLNNLLDILPTNLSRLSQEINANVLDLVKKKGFFPMTTGRTLVNFDESLLSKINFKIYWLILHLLANYAVSGKKYEQVLII